MSHGNVDLWIPNDGVTRNVISTQGSVGSPYYRERRELRTVQFDAAMHPEALFIEQIEEPAEQDRATRTA